MNAVERMGQAGCSWAEHMARPGDAVDEPNVRCSGD